MYLITSSELESHCGPRFQYNLLILAWLLTYRLLVGTGAVTLFEYNNKLQRLAALVPSSNQSFVLFYFRRHQPTVASWLSLTHGLTSRALAEAGGHFSQVSAPDILYSCAPVPLCRLWLWWLRGCDGGYLVTRSCSVITVKMSWHCCVVPSPQYAAYRRHVRCSSAEDGGGAGDGRLQCYHWQIDCCCSPCTWVHSDGLWVITCNDQGDTAPILPSSPRPMSVIETVGKSNLFANKQCSCFFVCICQSKILKEKDI